MKLHTMKLRTMVRFARGALLASFAALVSAALSSAPAQTPAPATSQVDEHAGHAHAADGMNDDAVAQMPPPRRTAAWDPEILKLAETLPIQEAGRIKPLSTFAAFKLLQLNGARTLSFELDHDTESTADDEKLRLTPTEWLLDCFFFPDQAVTYPCFQLQTSEVADAIHVQHEGKKKRDRYSYQELFPGRQLLADMAQKIADDPRTSDAKNRTAVEEQILQLAHKCMEFERLIGLGEFAYSAYPTKGSLSELLGGVSEVRFPTILEKGPLLMQAYRMLKDPSTEVEESTRAEKS